MGTTIGVIGGSGLYSIEGLTEVTSVTVDTPFGAPSGPIKRGKLGGADLLFLPRHGPNHSLSPSEVNYRANIYALKSLGATWCISVSAVGSLREELPPGTIVIPDQLIDRTVHRANTFFGDGLVAHVAFGDPYCPTLRAVLARVAEPIARAGDFTVVSGGTYVCMEGPAFSTRAESLLHRSWGASLIGMTALPEAKLAREAELAYATLALVTDYDCWQGDGHDVDVAQVMKTMETNARHAKSILTVAAEALLSETPSALAAHALNAALITPLEVVPAATLEKLKPIVQRRLSR